MLCKHCFLSTCVIAFVLIFSFQHDLLAQDYDTVLVSYSPASGLGPEEGVMRRDPSDIIKVNGQYYIWYTKGAIFSGYDATIWYATSTDGHQWTEQGEALQRGAVGAWDEQSVFTPNILMAEGKYWLFFTAVAKPFSKSNPVTKAEIGIAVSDSPDGPWVKLNRNPVLTISSDTTDFESCRVDDASLIVREGKYYMYFKGRQHNRSHKETKMGLAIAEKPQGPYKKYSGNPLLPGNHEVVTWPQGEGVTTMVGTIGPESITRSVLYAKDGINFIKTHIVIPDNVPLAAGVYRPEPFTDTGNGEMVEWGIHIGQKKGFLPYLERFEIVVK